MLNESQLLNHIYQTAEMGQDGIRAVLKRTDEPGLVSALYSQMREYRQLQRSASSLLLARGRVPKGIGAMAKFSSEAMTAMKTLADRSPSNIAQMMIQGSAMGVSKSLRTIRSCQVTDERVQQLADRLLQTEEANIQEMKRFL